MTPVRCQYCGHTTGTGASACANCGAPLPDARTVESPGGAGPAVAHGGLGAHLAEMSGRAGGPVSWPGAVAGHYQAAAARHHHHDSSPGATHEDTHGAAPHHRRGGVLGFLRSRIAGEAEAVVTAHHPKWQWRAAAGVAVAVLLVLAFLMVKSCALTGPPLTAPPGLGGVSAPGDPLAALPGPLRDASCRPHEETDGMRSCVLAAGSPVLAGGITGGRALSFQVHSAQPAALAQAIAQWRTASSEVVTDGEVFAAISASSAVWFADTNSGLRVDTGAFAGSAAARTFLARSGLLQS
ncbi:zinc ribbon domain-containing protein [Nocardia carnea]|uniref:zinc ribbon domain-containing protein n=1 Tax=Nocardia carnea TaxID=37328 RepID=UPI002454F6E9|nr:zinc ribbon domain-containing protein [Nocardia carnea]